MRIRSYKKNNLVICPYKHILGEIGTGGEFIVERHHQGNTVITGTDFTVSCFKCNETVFVRTRNIVSNIGNGTTV